MKDIIRDLFSSIEDNKDLCAFKIKNNSYTYKQLYDQICKVSSLIDNNTNNIGIIESDDIETYASILAVLILGKTYIIINPHNPIARNIRITELIKTDLILSKENNETFIELQKQHKCVITSELEERKEIQLQTSKKSNIAYILFTSGSTGVPKGVPISYGNLNSFYNNYIALGFKLDSNDKMLQMFDLCFDVSIVSTLYPLTIGASVYTVPMDVVKYTAVYELLEDENLTFAAIPPSILTLLRPYFSEINLPKLKYLILTAEASQVDIISEFIPSIPNAQVVNLYGPSEATIYCSSYFFNKNETKHYNGMLAIGNIFNNIDFVIIDKNNNNVNISEKGELCVSGDQVFSAYLNDKERTEEAFINISGKRYYRTGDICFVDSESDIFYCGRKDHQVQLNGFRVELSEIEYFIRSVHSGGNNVAIAIKDNNGNLELHLLVENYKEEEEKLHSIIKEHLPIYMHPRKIHRIDEFPLNASGKIDRMKLSLMINK